MQDYLFKLRQELYFDKKFSPAKSITIANLDLSENILPKIFASDFDHTLIAETAFNLVLKYSAREEQKLEKFLKDILLVVKEKIYNKQDFGSAVEEIKSILRKVPYEEKVYHHACKSASEEIVEKYVIPGSEEFREGLEERLYEIKIFSGSPKEAVAYSSKEIFNLDESSVAATEFIFKDGILYDINHMLGIRKYEALQKIIESKIGKNPRLQIAISKKPKFLYVAASDSPIDRFLGMNAGINPFILINEKAENISETTIHCPEARSNLKNVLPWIDRWEVCLIDSLKESKEEWENLIFLSEKICQNYQKFLNGNEEILDDLTEDLISLAKRRSYRINISNIGLDDLISKLRFASNRDEKINILNEIFLKLARYFPEISNKEFRDKFKNYFV